jgi:hypothetical protein
LFHNDLHFLSGTPQKQIDRNAVYLPGFIGTRRFGDDPGRPILGASRIRAGCRLDVLEIGISFVLRKEGCTEKITIAILLDRRLRAPVSVRTREIMGICADLDSTGSEITILWIIGAAVREVG